MSEPEIDVTECPDCAQKGHYDGRVLINGRGVYRCPDGHRWQDANEPISNKGIPLSPTAARTTTRHNEEG
jgi:hypothetical protein